MHLRAIVIDDDEACRSLLAQVLRQRGYEVICLPDPTACPLYENSACSCPEEAVCGDFLLTDNRMPGMSGLELIARQVQGGCKGNVGNKAVLSGTWSGGGNCNRRRCSVVRFLTNHTKPKRLKTGLTPRKKLFQRIENLSTLSR